MQSLMGFHNLPYMLKEKKKKKIWVKEIKVAGICSFSINSICRWREAIYHKELGKGKPNKDNLTDNTHLC